MLRPQRLRRTGSLYGQVWPLEGISTGFGQVAVSLLLIVGLAILLMRQKMTWEKLGEVQEVVQAAPYRSAHGSEKGAILIPLHRARTWRVEGYALEAADTARLVSLKPGQTLRAWLTKDQAAAWRAGEAGKYTRVLLLQDDQDNWIIPLDAYRRAAGREGRIGWWLVALALLLLPYLFIARPRIKATWMLLAYSVALIWWLMQG